MVNLHMRRTVQSEEECKHCIKITIKRGYNAFQRILYKIVVMNLRAEKLQLVFCGSEAGGGPPGQRDRNGRHLRRTLEQGFQLTVGGYSLTQGGREGRSRGVLTHSGREGGAQ